MHSITAVGSANSNVPWFRRSDQIFWSCQSMSRLGPMLYICWIDDFRGACAVKGNVQVAGRTSSVSTTEMLSTHDVTLRNVDGSLFHVHIWFVMGHQDQIWQNWRNISQFTMWLSQSSVNVYQTYQSLYQFQHFAAKCDSAMDKWCLPQ